jgi:uncharacterized DUF497 family protein
MAFEWGEERRVSNLAKHGVDFQDLPPLFDGDVLEVPDERKDYGETRINCLGEIEGRVYVVVYTWRAESRRIISARRANAREQTQYHARNL